MSSASFNSESSSTTSNASSTPMSQPSKVSKGRLRTGWVITILIGLFLLFDAVGKLVVPVQVADAAVKLGFAVNLMPGIGILLLVSTITYLVPRTAILGAILLTGFLGGAVAIQLRAGSPLFENLFPVLFAILMWAGIYLRECRLTSIFPIRR